MRNAVDLNGDGIPDQVITQMFNTEGELVLTEADTDADGIVDVVTTYKYTNINGERAFTASTAQD